MKNSPDDPDDSERHELEDRGDDLDAAALAGAEDVGEREQPDQRDRDQRSEQVVARRLGPEHGEVAHERDGDRGVARPDGDPVSPGRLEADEVAERTARVGIGTAGARKGPSEVREDEREQDCSGAREHPSEEGDRTGRVGQRGRQEEDTRADHVADDQGRGHPQPHRSLELGARRRSRGLVERPGHEITSGTPLQRAWDSAPIFVRRRSAAIRSTRDLALGELRPVQPPPMCRL